MNLQEATPDDAEAVVELIAQLGYTISKADLLENIAIYQKQKGCIVIAVDLNTIVGFASGIFIPLFHAKENMFRITALCVHEKERNKSVGKALICYMEERCKEQGCYYIEVTSGVHRKDDAHFFYKHLGYTVYEGNRFLKRLASDAS